MIEDKCNCGAALDGRWKGIHSAGCEALKDEKPLTAPSPTDILREINAHLVAAISQSLPSDDQIIMGHVRSACDLVSILYHAQIDRKAA